MTADPRKLKGAAALAEIVERLTGLGAEVQKALETGTSREDGFDVETPLGRMSGRFGVKVGPASARPPGAAPRRPARPATKTPEALVDVHFDGVTVVVTTETDDPAAQVSVDGQILKIRSARAAERSIGLPCRVQPNSLRVSLVNGVLEATLTAESAS